MPRALSPALNFALAAALAGFALAAFSPGVLNDGDTYWHIRAGEWMLAHGSVLRNDVFSDTAAGNSWHTQEWLAEILMALSWRGGLVCPTGRSPFRPPTPTASRCASRAS